MRIIISNWFENKEEEYTNVKQVELIEIDNKETIQMKYINENSEVNYIKINPSDLIEFKK